VPARWYNRAVRKTKRPFGFSGWRWELLGAVTGQTLEIGCGWGYNFAHYPATVDLVAFDIEMARVRSAARQPNLNLPFRLSVTDAEQLPFPNNYFDSVVGTLVFCSIPHPDRALAEIQRVLKPGGRLYLIDHVRSHHSVLAHTQDFLAPVWHRVTGGCNLNRNTEETVRAAGYHLERLKIGWGGLLKLMVAIPTIL